MNREDAEEYARRATKVEAERQAQGLPPRVSDPGALREIARLLEEKPLRPLRPRGGGSR